MRFKFSKIKRISGEMFLRNSPNSLTDSHCILGYSPLFSWEVFPDGKLLMNGYTADEE